MTAVYPSRNANWEFDKFSTMYYKVEASPSPPQAFKILRLAESPYPESQHLQQIYIPTQIVQPSLFGLTSRSDSPFSVSSDTMASADDPNKEYNDKDWKSIQDREERRRVQNRNAQRRHRDRRRQEDEEKQRIATHQEVAGSAYTPARFEDVNPTNPEGLPWGAFALTNRDIAPSNTSSPFSSPEMSTRDRTVTHDPFRVTTSRYASVGISERLEVPQLSYRGLASSTSVPQLRNAALAQIRPAVPGLVRSKSSSNTSLKRKQDDGDDAA